LGSSTSGKGGIYYIIDKSSLKKPTLTLQCERSDVYKPPKTRKKLKLEGTNSRNVIVCVRLRDFFEKITKDW